MADTSSTTRIRSIADITRQPPTLMPSDSEVAEGQDGVMRKCWERVMCKELGTPNTYQKVAVLIIRWDDSLDKDLKTKGEVEELNQLFRHGFNFESEVVVLHNYKRPQTQIDSAVARFVEEHDGHHRGHLLVVYYTGHGFLKAPNFDNLIVSGKQSEAAIDGGYLPEAKWDQAETSLNDAEADVLTIMDCCFAGSVMKNITEHSKLYELLAACGKDDMTEKPGERSYTRALINSLKEVLKKDDKRILTFDLNQMVLNKRRWNSKSHVYNRLQTSTTRHICLAPLPQRQQASLINAMPRNAGHLNLRIAFREHSTLKSEHVEKLAMKVSQAAKDAELSISAIDWMGFEPYRAEKQFRVRVRLVMAMNRWLRKRDESNKRKRSLDDAQEEEHSAKRHQHLSANHLEGNGDGRDSVGKGELLTPEPDEEKPPKMP